MKEIVRVHLAKTGYDIEVEAKKALASYLEGIERAMGSEEVMYEIEARMVELLAERGVAAGSVITKADVAALREQMGEPQEFFDGDAHSATDAEVGAEGERPAKRLMRDPDNALLGGVCAGLAAYWGINVLWVRLLFVLSPFLTAGVALLIYIVLWLSMSEARTAAEKLQMRGEAVTLDALRQFSHNNGVSRRAKVTAMKTVQIITVCILSLAAFGILIALLFGGFIGASAIAWMSGFAAQPWAWGALTSLLVGSVAAVLLLSALTSAAVRWKMTRGTIVMIIITMTIGALSAAATGIFAVQANHALSRDVRRLTKTVQIPLPSDVTGLKYVDVSGDDHVATRLVSGDEVKVEMEYIDHGGVRPPRVTAVRVGDTLQVSVEDDHSEYCPRGPLFLMRECWHQPVQIKITGPFTFKRTDAVPYRHEA